MSIDQRRHLALLTIGQMWHVHDYGPSMHELRELLGYHSTGAVSYLLRVLEGEGLIEQRRLDSGRVVARSVRLTPQGLAACRS